MKEHHPIINNWQIKDVSELLQIVKKRKIVLKESHMKVKEHAYKILVQRIEPVFYKCKYCEKEGYKTWEEKFNHFTSCKIIKQLWEISKEKLNLNLNKLSKNYLLIGKNNLNNIQKLKINNEYIKIVSLHLSILESKKTKDNFDRTKILDKIIEKYNEYSSS